MGPGPRASKRTKKQAQEDGSGQGADSPARKKPGRPRKEKGEADVQPDAHPAGSVAVGRVDVPLLDSGESVASGDKLDFEGLLARQGRQGEAPRGRGRPRKVSPAVEPSRLYRMVREAVAWVRYRCFMCVLGTSYMLGCCHRLDGLRFLRWCPLRCRTLAGGRGVGPMRWLVLALGSGCDTLGWAPLTCARHVGQCLPQGYGRALGRHVDAL